MSKYQTQKGRIFEAELRKNMKLRHMESLEDVRKLTSIGSNVTFLKYIDDPELIPMGKMGEILEAVKMPKDDRLIMITKIVQRER